MLANAIGQCRFDCRIVGLRIGPARQADGAEPPAARRGHRPCRGVEGAVVAGLDPRRRTGRSPRLRRAPRPTGCGRRPHGRRLRRPPATGCAPAVTRDRGGSRGRRPTANARRSASRRRDRRSGKARATALPSGWPCASATPARLAQISAMRLAALARGPVSVRQRRKRTSRSGSLPPRPRSVSKAAACAATAAKPSLPRLDHHVRQPRLERPAGNGAAVRESNGRLRRARRASPAAAALRPRRRAAAGRGRAGGPGRLSPQVRQARTRPDKSASRISGGSCAGSEPVAASSHRRMAMPGRLARGAAGALGDGGAAGALGDQAGEAGAAVVAWPPGQTGIDDDADIVQRQAGFGDGGGEDQLAFPRRRAGEGGALGGRLDLRHAGGGGRHPPGAGPVPRPCARFRRSRAGRRAASLDVRPSARRMAAAICGSIRSAAWRPTCSMVSGQALPSLTIRGGSPSRLPNRAPSMVADIATMRRSGPQRRRRVEREGERQVIVEAAFMHLVEQDRGDAFQFGIGLDSRQEDAVGHGDDARRLADLAVEAGRIAEGPARLLAVLRGDELDGGAGRQAARHQQQDLATLASTARRARPARPSSSCRRPAARPARRACPRAARPAAREERRGRKGHAPANRPGPPRTRRPRSEPPWPCPAGNRAKASIARRA